MVPHPEGSQVHGGSAGRSIPVEEAGFVQDMARLWTAHLGDRLCGLYLIGSLAHGGYGARYSDIDLALIVETPLTTGELDEMKRQTVAHGGSLAKKLSLFWADASFSTGRMPPLDRIDYLDHAVPLVERRRVAPARPTVQAIRDYLSGEPFHGWQRQVARFTELDQLTTENHKGYVRVLLYPARFLYSWDNGTVASNDDAVAYVERQALLGAELDIVLRALACRADGRDPSHLFPERHRLARLLAICSKRIADSPGAAST